MTPTQYIRLRKQLGLSNYALAPILGVSLRQAQRYEAGEAPIPKAIANLLQMYAKFGYDHKIILDMGKTKSRQIGELEKLVTVEPQTKHKDGIQ
jgi:predicted transcriptional regulator